MNYAKSISKDEINQLPMMEWKGRIEVVIHPERAVEVAEHLADRDILGFDTETRPSFRADQQYTVSLLQLASRECAYLFRLKHTGLPPELAAVLADPKVIKTGVAIRDDVKALQKIRPFVPAGFVDIADETDKRGFKNAGLRGLTAIFLGQRMSKAAKLTNWDQPHLTTAQLHYAALDAVAGLLVYQKVMQLPVPGQVKAGG